MSLMQMSIGGGALILFTILVRFAALNRLPKTTFLILWGITILRLLLPVSIPSPFSVYTQAERIFRSYGLEAPVTESAQMPASASVPASEVPPSQAAPVPVLTILWLTGAFLLMAYFTIVYVKSRRKFRTSLPEKTPFVRDWLAQRRILRPVQVRQLDRITSPLTYGVLHPVILLPKGMDRSNEAALACVLTHEYIHIRRFDAMTKLVLAAALCVHWFNPLMWVMYFLANRDLELSCDEQALHALGKQGRAPYALTLLEMEERRQKGFALFNHFGKLAMEERIEAIVKYKKASAFAIILALALIIGAATVFAASAASGTPDAGDSSQADLSTQPLAVADGTDGGDPAAGADLREASDENVLFSGFMTYEQFLQSGSAESVDHQLKPDSRILVTVIYYPNGYEYAGLIPNRPASGLAISLYDAETLELLGRDFFEAEVTSFDPDKFDIRTGEKTAWTEDLGTSGAGEEKTIPQAEDFGT